MAKSRIIRTHPRRISVTMALRFSLSSGGRSAAERETAIKDKVRYAMRMAYSKSDGNGTALRDSEQRKAIQSSRIDDRCKIADPRVQRKFIHIPIGHAVAASVVADQRMVLRKIDEAGAPERTFQSYSRWVNQEPLLTNGRP